MARNPQTLFEQYHASIRKDDTQWIHNPALRWSVIALTSVVVAIFIPPLSQFLPGSIAPSSQEILFVHTIVVHGRCSIVF